MQNVMGVITFNECQTDLKELTQNRPLAALPFAGRYRVIDFILSSMVNSGIQNVGVLVEDKYRALMDHLRSGKEWDLARKQDGLFILPPSRETLGGGSVESFYQHLDYLQSSRQSYVLMAGTQVISNLDYRKAFRFHQDTKADITVLYREQSEPAGPAALILDCREDGRITRMELGQKRYPAKVSMEMYLMKKELLMELVRQCRGRGEVDFVRDALVKNCGALTMMGYCHKGYTARMDSVEHYYRHNMELLKLEKWEELFFKAGLVYTKIKDDAPVKYKEGAKVTNSMIANGCIVDGHVENSILFRGVQIEKGAYVKDSIIMQSGKVGSNAVLEHVICDKNARISDGKWLKGEKNQPLVVEKGAVL